MEIQQTETLDKYRVEINKPTTGGVMGFSVRVTGAHAEVTMNLALELAVTLDGELAVKFPKQEPKK